MKKKKSTKPAEVIDPTYQTEGYWEEYMLESNSYYDIDILEKHNAPIRKKIENLILAQSKSSWIGKWYYQIQIDKLTGKLKHYK